MNIDHLFEGVVSISPNLRDGWTWLPRRGSHGKYTNMYDYTLDMTSGKL